MTMPPKKKKSTSSKKKKGKKHQSDAETYEDAQRWSQKGRVDPKGLSKTLPGVASGLRDGAIDPKNLAEDLARSHMQDVLPVNQQFALKDDPQKVGTLQDLIFLWLASTLYHQDRSDDDRDEYNGDSNSMKDRIYQDLKNRYNYKLQKARDKHGIFHAAAHKGSDILQNSFNEICDKWELRILQKTGKSIKETCPVYKVPPAKFTQSIHNSVLDQVDINEDQIQDLVDGASSYERHYNSIKVAAQGVANGLDRFRDMCWECGKCPVVSQKCSQCKAARYCSKQCQVTAWRSGHKNACKVIKGSYECFNLNLQCADKALKSGFICEEYEDFSPCPDVDYRVMMLMNIKEFHHNIVQNPDESVSIMGPSMDVFYKNLGEVLRGGSHWIFSHSDAPKHSVVAESTCDTNGEHFIENLQDWEYNLLVDSAGTLAYDVSNSPPKENKIVTMFIETCRAKVIESSRIKQLMSADRFVCLYIGLSKTSCETDTTSFRSTCITESFNIFKDFYHKKCDLDVETLEKYQRQSSSRTS